MSTNTKTAKIEMMEECVTTYVTVSTKRYPNSADTVVFSDQGALWFFSAKEVVALMNGTALPIPSEEFKSALRVKHAF